MRSSSGTKHEGVKIKCEMEEEASTLMESAIQLFSKKHGLSQQAVRAAMTDHETLPSIHDPAAIDAFFRKNRRRSFREIVNANLHLKKLETWFEEQICIRVLVFSTYFRKHSRRVSVITRYDYQSKGSL
uniref:HTH psq-type domain-containing protein n=1 Tax=Heterorhabditis bacteriophora TaxID=37862 RepID=A0A1I7XJA1_HETBA